MNDKKIAIAIANGYVEKGYGYVKSSNNITHWITLFDSKRLQLYGYYGNDVECSAYNTEVIIANEDEFQTLINIFTRK